MKKIFTLLVVLFTVFLFSACEAKPEEHCVTDWDYKMVEKLYIAISYTTYWLETEHGDVRVSKNIYESAQNDEYSEVCVTVQPDGGISFTGGTLKDGTPIDENIIEEIEDQIVPEPDDDM